MDSNNALPDEVELHRSRVMPYRHRARCSPAGRAATRTFAGRCGRRASARAGSSSMRSYCRCPDNDERLFRANARGELYPADVAGGEVLEDHSVSGAASRPALRAGRLGHLLLRSGERPRDRVRAPRTIADVATITSTGTQAPRRRRHRLLRARRSRPLSRRQSRPDDERRISPQVIVRRGVRPRRGVRR